MGLIISMFLVIVALVVAGVWLRNQFPKLARQVLKETGEDFLALAKKELELEHQKGLSELHAKKTAVENAVTGLQDQLHRYEALVREFESDRDRKYGQLKSELAHVTRETDTLRSTTANLVAVLGNSRVRGQWGQKMAEDILRLCGLQEGIHYHREKEVGTGRPDYTFLLPDEHTLFMDVKFPLDHYRKVVESTREEERLQHREAFIRDVREHLREMERRDYLAQTDQSVDYILIFIPNEQVYGLVNEWMPLLIDECLQKKIILCGPWTLYAVVRIILQAWQNYHFSVAIRDIVKEINRFRHDYGTFKDRFEELGKLLQKVSDEYHDISAKSYQRLEHRVKRIEEYRKGQGIPEESVESDTEPLKQLSSIGAMHD
ncbi:MAG: DNA recombination protein RmuC [Candidatus Omnitrophica bacterium]|nr:DNA recombination protein RmuC [Candidatus Omnitrophota bacterium]